MSGILLTIIKMSLSASIAAFVVMLARLCLRKAPKIFSYVLWAAVLFRMVCPFGIPVTVSCFPELTAFSAKTDVNVADPAPEAKEEADYIHDNTLHTGQTYDTQELSESENSIYPADYPSAQSDIPPAEAAGTASVLNFLAYIWLSGALAMLSYFVWSYWKLSKKLGTAIHIIDNVFESDLIYSALVLGSFRTRIYIPSGLPVRQKRYVVMHEREHIRRRDYLVKYISFIALSLHWFNPVMWLGFSLMVKDMESSCDEAVIGRLTDKGYPREKVTAEYGETLLSLAERNSLAAQVSFAENNVKERILNIMRCRKRNAVSNVCFIIICSLLMTACVSSPSGGYGSMNEEDQNNADSDSIVLTDQDALLICLGYSKDASLILNSDTASASNGLFELTVDSACVINDEVEITYILRFLEGPMEKINNASSGGHFYDAVKELGYDIEFEEYFEEIPLGIGEDLSLKSTSLTFDGKPLAGVKKEMHATERASHYIGMEVFSLEGTDIYSTADRSTFVYSTGDIAIPLTLVTPNLYGSDNDTMNSAYRYKTAHGVTLLAVAAIENGTLTADLYPVDTGKYEKLVQCFGDVGEHRPYILANGSRIYGQSVDTYSGVYLGRTCFRWEFDISGIGSGDIKLCYDAVCVVSGDSITIPVTSDIIGNNDSLRMEYALQDGSFALTSIGKDIEEYNGENLLRLGTELRSERDGIILGAFRKATVTGNSDNPCGYIIMQHNIGSSENYFLDVTEMSIPTGCAYEEIRSITLEQPESWLINAFSFEFNIDDNGGISVA